MSATPDGGSTDREALIREYKERRPVMGIFQLRNLATGKLFIGASTDVPAMLNRQQAQLRLGMHPNRQLQLDWQTLGPEATERWRPLIMSFTRLFGLGGEVHPSRLAESDFMRFVRGGTGAQEVATSRSS